MVTAPQLEPRVITLEARLPPLEGDLRAAHALAASASERVVRLEQELHFYKRLIQSLAAILALVPLGLLIAPLRDLFVRAVIPQDLTLCSLTVANDTGGTLQVDPDHRSLVRLFDAAGRERVLLGWEQNDTDTNTIGVVSVLGDLNTGPSSLRASPGHLLLLGQKQVDLRANRYVGLQLEDPMLATTRNASS